MPTSLATLLSRHAAAASHLAASLVAGARATVRDARRVTLPFLLAAGLLAVLFGD